MNPFSNLLRIFDGETIGLTPLQWFSLGVGHFPTIFTSLKSRVWSIPLLLYCTLFNFSLASHIVLSTYFNLNVTGAATMSIALLINHMCHVCASFLAPIIAWLGWKDWQMIIVQLSNPYSWRHCGNKGKSALKPVIIALILNLAWFSWSAFLNFYSNIADTSDVRIMSRISWHLNFGFALLESFTDTLIPLQFYVCCWLIKSQYQQMKTYLEDKLQNRDEKSLGCALDLARKSLLNIWQTAESVNAYFGVPLLITLCAKIVRGTSNLYSLIRLISASNYHGVLSLLWNVLFLSLDVAVIIVILWAADSVTDSFYSFGRIVAEISTLKLDESTLGQVNCFMGQLKHLKVELHAAAFFSLGKRLCCSIVATVSTYIFVLMQFDFGESKNCPGSKNATS